jgi:hypothetical protein
MEIVAPSRVARTTDTRRNPTAYAAAVWAAVFAVFHVIWATGWYIGLDEPSARVAFAKRGTLIYDLVVAGICVFAVPVSLSLTMAWGRRVPRRLIAFCIWTGTGMLVLRAGASLIQVAYFIVTRPQFRLTEIGKWELWFYLGATLFTISAWRFSRTA